MICGYECAKSNRNRRNVKIIMQNRYIFQLTLIGLASLSAHGGTVEFNRDIRPILSENCYSCHGFDAKHRKADLRLDTPEGAYADNDGVFAIVPGDLAKSESWLRIISEDEDEIMPPPKSHKTLKPEQKELIKRWIEEGAAYQKHWAFEAPVKIAPPVVDTAQYPVKTPIDAFLAERLAKEGLAFSPEADKPTLIRRVSFALTGLPPTPAEVDQFLADSSPDAYGAMVDRYMASPRFGEEMARYWLDVARYADTHGLHLDNERQMWAYRDWVVRAFGRNQPFDQFTIEQLAGDQLPEPSTEQLIATGFNRCNVTTSEGGSINEEFIYRYAVERTSTTFETWMGLTGGCAVCHDHKFDPISAKEFYSMYAFFNSAADPAMDGNALLTAPVMKITTPEIDATLADLDKQATALQTELDKATAAYVYQDPAEMTPPPADAPVEIQLLEDDFPQGAKVQVSPGNPATTFVTAENGQVFSGTRALKRTDAGLAQDYYNEGAAVMTIPPAGVITAHVFLDPANPPKSIMIQFHKGAWAHRVVWGDYDAIDWGAKNTVERVHAGPLPELGKWAKIEFEAAKLGLNPGDQVEGYALTQFGGTVFWDKISIIGVDNPARDPSQSFTAWWTASKGKDVAQVPNELKGLVKAGPEAAKPEDRAKVRSWYLQNINKTAVAALGDGAIKLAEARKKKADIEAGVPSTFIFKDLPKPRDSFVMDRGQYDKPGEKVEPATPAMLPPLVKASPEGRATRMDLAKWLVDPAHPLTARVTVNRFWQQFFGIGLVKTSNDFGSQGEPPSHPALLDWLAVDFREGGWNVKSLVRQFLMSHAFRQQSFVTPDLWQKDPENRLYARSPRFRLDAEQIRDNALFTSGLLVEKQGGPGVKPYQPANIWEPVAFGGSNTQFYKQDSGEALYRRSLYVFFKRTAPPPFMTNFDAPNRELSCSRRERSNTPLQALHLMNDVQHVESARHLAGRMIKEGGATPAERIAFAWKVVLSRAPDANEMAITQAQFEAHRERYSKDEAAATALISTGESKPDPALPPVELAAYTLVANMILNLDETLTRN
jgi:hypothetical protein